MNSFGGFRLFGYDIKRIQYLITFFFIFGTILSVYNYLPARFFEYLSRFKKFFSTITDLQAISILLVISIFGIILRMNNLGSLTFWQDEAIQTYAAIGLMQQGIPVMPSGMIYSRAFLDTLLIAQSFKIFGINEFAARMPSALFGVLTIPLIYLAGKELGNKRVGIIAALLITFSVFENIYNRDARMYSQFQFLYLLTAFLFYIYIKNKNWKIIPAIIGSFILAYYSHSQIHIFTLIAFLYIIYIYFRNNTYIKPYMLFGILFSILVFSDLIYMIFFAPDSVPTGGSKTIMYYVIIPEHIMLFAIIFIVGIIFLISRNYDFYEKENNFFLFISFFFPLLIITSYPWRSHRYTFFIYPFLVIMVSKILDYTMIQNGLDNEINKIFRNIKISIINTKNIKILINILIISLITSELAYNFNPLNYEQTSNQGKIISQKTADFIKTNLDKDDKVASTEALVTLYYIGKSDYFIRKSGFEDGRNGTDRFSSSIILRSYDSFMNIIQHEKGWLISARDDLKEPNVDQKVIDYIRNNMTYYPEASDEITEVYSWGKVRSNNITGMFRENI